MLSVYLTPLHYRSSDKEKMASNVFFKKKTKKKHCNGRKLLSFKSSLLQNSEGAGITGLAILLLFEMLQSEKFF